MSVVPRHVINGTLAGLILIAIVTASLQAALLHHAIGPAIAALLGLALLPILVKSARYGHMHTTTAWTAAVVGCIICSVAVIGLTPEKVDAVSISWLTCGVLAGSVMVWITGHHSQPLVAVTYLVGTIAVWAGPLNVIQLGLAAEIVLVITGLLMRDALQRVTETNRQVETAACESTLRHAELDAYQRERQDRLREAGRTAGPMLQQIINREGQLDAAGRAECAVLEQTLRDEIRGRRLLNDALRATIRTHRQRGALVQVLDDGGLDDLAPEALNNLLNDVAQRLGPVRSSRIVIRTADPDSPTAITIVASSPNETAAALGLDADNKVELWAALSRPAPAASPPSRHDP